jgi:muconolactone delta-isomerase
MKRQPVQLSAVPTTRRFTQVATTLCVPEFRSTVAVTLKDALRKKNAEIGQDLELLHFWRKRADYDNLQLTDVDEQANSAVILARETIDAIQAIL